MRRQLAPNHIINLIASPIVRTKSTVKKWEEAQSTNNVYEMSCIGNLIDQKKI